MNSKNITGKTITTILSIFFICIITNTTQAAVVDGVLEISPTPITFNDVTLGQNAQIDVTIHNTDAVNPVQPMNFDFVGINANYNARTQNFPAALNPDETATFQILLTIPQNESNTQHTIGSIVVSGNSNGAGVSTRQDIILNPKDLLSIEKVEIDSKSNGDLSIDSNTKFDVTVKNNAGVDLEDVTVTVTVLDVDNDDIDEDSDSDDVDNGDDQDFRVDIDLSGEVLDKESYSIKIEVEGQDENGVEYRGEKTINADLDLDSHKLILKKLLVTPSTVQCSNNARLEVTVQNQGKKDEDEVVIKVTNGQLQINLIGEEMSIDRFTQDEDNEESEYFQINTLDAKAGTYDLTVEVYRNENNLEDTKTVPIIIQTCQTLQPTTQTSTPSTTQTNQQYAQQLQNQLNTQANAQTPNSPATSTPTVAPTSVIKSTFRESKGYTIILGIMIVLGLIAMALAMGVLMTRRKN